jgi:hypothetical protein
MGNNIFREVTIATGLPPELISEELNKLIEKAGLESDHLTLEQLRFILSEYVQDILLKAKEDLAATETTSPSDLLNTVK